MAMAAFVDSQLYFLHGFYSYGELCPHKKVVKGPLHKLAIADVIQVVLVKDAGDLINQSSLVRAID